MGEHDEQRLTRLLRHADPAPLDAVTVEDIYERAWEAIRAGMAEEHRTADATGGRNAESTAGTAGTAGTARPAQVAARRLDVIAAADARARRRRRVARTSAITTAVLLAGAGTAAASTYLATRTGQHTSGWQMQAAGSGELLNLEGDDRVQVMRELIADIPYAPGYEDLREAEPVTGSLRSEKNAQVSDSAARAWVARDAICTWADAWVAADSSRDRVARDAATAALAGSLQWPAVREVDPDPSPTGYLGDEGVGSPTQFGWVPGIVTAAQGGQRQAVLDAVAHDYSCFPEYTPAMNEDPDYAGPPR
ncbi:hypothetical protein OG218_15135 [Kineococcus sp. NBC_00420]|uniref:hypothetical protein n=1 Tax=Kineococcus sp. NBC_00420 TaxID=2903564 RepID=UPI002E2110CC